MLHADQPEIRARLLEGEFGLEKESLRVDQDGFLAHTEHPFRQDDRHIVRDFCENQTEINTPVFKSVHGAVQSLNGYYEEIQRALKMRTPREYLWPFSNPPYIRDEEDVPIADFTGPMEEKTVYRRYLSDRYGRYKMTFSGIHVNFSFDQDLLERDFVLSGESDFRRWKDSLYLTLARRLVAYGWLLVAATAASPLLDGSFVEKGRYDVDEFNGMGSVRCSEMGYWNFFAPVLDYSSVRAYADSIQHYVDEGWIQAPSELYYPIRLKPAGKNSLDNLRNNGINHIELRMFDLNPLVPVGVDERDVEFAHLLMVWLSSTPDQGLTRKDQVQAIQNFKNAAHFDLTTVKIVLPDGEIQIVAEEANRVIRRMREFYQDFPVHVHDVLDFEAGKFQKMENCYSWQVRQQFSGGYVKKGLDLARKRQDEVPLLQEAAQ